MSTEPKFTKGPWTIGHRKGGPLTGFEAELAELEDCEPFALSVVEIKEPRFERTFDSRVAGAEDTAIANAHLIAAAPELYREGRASARTMDDVADALGERGLLDLADELRVRARLLRLACLKAEGH